MIDQALRFLLDTVFGIITYAFLLRFTMQWLRAPFRNPLGQAVVALTDWAAKPVRRVVPGFRGLDASTLVMHPATLRQMREALQTADAVDPHAASTGTPSTRVNTSCCLPLMGIHPPVIRTVRGQDHPG